MPEIAINYRSIEFVPIPLILVGLLFQKTLKAPGSPFRSLVAIGIACIVMSLLLALAEFIGTRKRNFDRLTSQDGWWVGVVQALAIVPGVSRSGSTITGALFLGMERETAAKFSFLLGLPAVILAGAAALHELLKAGLSMEGWLLLLVGLISGSISSFAAIYGLLRYLEKQSTWIFVWYRLAMGLFLIFGSLQGFCIRQVESPQTWTFDRQTKDLWVRIYQWNLTARCDNN